MTFTDWLRKITGGLMSSIGGALNKLGIHPDWITLFGFIGICVSGFFISRGSFVVGGIIYLLMGLMDAVDGAVARARGEITSFGMFLDSVTDRYSELVIFFCLLIYFLNSGDREGVILSYVAAAGSTLVSYTRARAQSVDIDAKVGILTRVERFIVLVPGLLFGYPKISLWVIAVLANFTALQRILYVRQKTSSNSFQKEK